MENKKGFLTMNVGTTMDKNGNPLPYAFMVEGIVTNVGNFREAADGKPAALNLSVLVGRDPWDLLGKDVKAEQASNPNINDEHRFVSLGVFGADAVRLKDIQKNAKIVFCGRPVKNCYKKKTGEDVTAVAVNTDSVYQVQTKYGEADDLRQWIPSSINRYESQGEVRTQHLGLISCEVVNGVNVNTTPSGRTVASVKVRLAVPALEADARINRTYSKDADYGSYMEATISVWGPRATKMEKILAPGNRLVVTASSKVNTGSNGLQYVNFSVRDLSVLKWSATASGNNTSQAQPEEDSAPAAGSADTGTNEQEGGFAPIMDNDEFDLPF